ncbi:uncharacterized protein J3D65DRAFT_227827 [Phyllosticta citribraziliensis]|uniref:Uncharacterized protein n=1 Tax=Phyllosticta citribraziliensis TaxID=989973 RepID=A0ABR1M586_9PEZI
MAGLQTRLPLQQRLARHGQNGGALAFSDGVHLLRRCVCWPRFGSQACGVRARHVWNLEVGEVAKKRTDQLAPGGQSCWQQLEGGLVGRPEDQGRSDGGIVAHVSRLHLYSSRAVKLCCDRFASATLRDASSEPLGRVRPVRCHCRLGVKKGSGRSWVSGDNRVDSDTPTERKQSSAQVGGDTKTAVSLPPSLCASAPPVHAPALSSGIIKRSSACGPPRGACGLHHFSC